MGWKEDRVWEPDKRHEGANAGWRTAETCPECGDIIVYNGNYFCINFGDECGWAMPHPQVVQADKEIYKRLMDALEK